MTSADTVPPGLGTAAPQAALISGLACGHPLEADVKDMIAAQFDDAQARRTAIGPGHHGDSTASQSPGRPAWLPTADIGVPATAGTGPAERADADGRPAAAAAQASPAQGRQGPGDRGKELPVVVPPMPPGSAKSRTNSLRARSTTGNAGHDEPLISVTSPVEATSAVGALPSVVPPPSATIVTR